MDLHDFDHAMVLMDGPRVVAHARRTGSGPWLVRGRALCLLDKPGGPLAPNILGIADPTGCAVRSKPMARRILRRLADAEGAS